MNLKHIKREIFDYEANYSFLRCNEWYRLSIEGEFFKLKDERNQNIHLPLDLIRNIKLARYQSDAKAMEWTEQFYATPFDGYGYGYKASSLHSLHPSEDHINTLQYFFLATPDFDKEYLKYKIVNYLKIKNKYSEKPNPISDNKEVYSDYKEFLDDIKRVRQYGIHASQHYSNALNALGKYPLEEDISLFTKYLRYKSLYSSPLVRKIELRDFKLVPIFIYR